MKVVKNIAYDGAPQESESGLIAKVKILIGEESESDPLFFAPFNHVVTIEYSQPCKSVGDAIDTIKSCVVQSCEMFLQSNFNQ